MKLSPNKLLLLSKVARGELERDEDGNVFFWRDHDWNSRILDCDLADLIHCGYVVASQGPSVSGSRVRLDVAEKYFEEGAR